MLQAIIKLLIGAAKWVNHKLHSGLSSIWSKSRDMLALYCSLALAYEPHASYLRKSFLIVRGICMLTCLFTIVPFLFGLGIVIGFNYINSEVVPFFFYAYTNFVNLFGMYSFFDEAAVLSVEQSGDTLKEIETRFTVLEDKLKENGLILKELYHAQFNSRLINSGITPDSARQWIYDSNLIYSPLDSKELEEIIRHMSPEELRKIFKDIDNLHDRNSELNVSNSQSVILNFVLLVALGISYYFSSK